MSLTNMNAANKVAIQTHPFLFGQEWINILVVNFPPAGPLNPFCSRLCTTGTWGISLPPEIRPVYRGSGSGKGGLYNPYATLDDLTDLITWLINNQYQVMDNNLHLLHTSRLLTTTNRHHTVPLAVKTITYIAYIPPPTSSS
jgi:hypothetical protein